MADFHLDHNVAVRVAPLLHAYGHAAVSARDLRLGHVDDHEHLLIAAEAQRILVTHNWKDFRLLHNAWRRWSQAWQVTATHAGILVLPQSWLAPQSAQEIDRLMTSIQASGQSLANSLQRWEPNVGWVVY